MAGAGVTHSELATKLIVEGALAGIAGTVQGQMPMAPVILTALERADMGMPQTGHTMFYPVPPTGVFFDLDGAQCSVWFMGADGDVALSRVDAAMKRAFSKTKQLKDDVDPTDSKQRLRRYEVDFGNSRLAMVEIIYPARGAPPKKFLARITAQTRRN